MSEKIQPQHLARKAVLYVRQSTAFQVTRNQESGKLQYAMQARLRDLGFTEIEVIDADLGRSAAGTAARHPTSAGTWIPSMAPRTSHTPFPFTT